MNVNTMGADSLVGNNSNIGTRVLVSVDWWAAARNDVS